MVQQQGDLRSKVLAAFQQLPAKRDMKHELETAVSAVVVLVGRDATRRPEGSPLPAFNVVGSERVREELKRTVTYADRLSKPSRKGQADPMAKLASHMLTLHRPTIDALAARGVLRHDLSQPAKVAAVARYVDLSRLPVVPGGRPANLRAQGIARVVAWHYEQVTGKRVGVSKGAFKSSDYGPFVRLLDDVFQIAGIRADPYVVAIAACKTRKNR